MAPSWLPKENPCGYNCSYCCLIFSLWGLLMLVVIGILTQVRYRGIDGDQHRIGPHYHDVAVQCYIAAGIYGLFVVISLARIFHLNFLSKRQGGSLDHYASVSSSDS